MRVLVVNAGSSTLKVSLLDHDDTVLATHRWFVEAGRFDAAEFAVVLHSLGGTGGADGRGGVDAVGHRVVHGGPDLRGPVRLDDATTERIRALTELAPLHQPVALAGIDATRQVLPDVPQVACFDTAFHASIPPAAATYAVPRWWRFQYGVRRYGFHGLAHSWATRRVTELLGGGGPPRRLVSCQLGAGASLAAVRSGRCVDTTMGFTPIEGLVMATRSGNVDPGAVLWMQQRHGLSADEVSDVLDHHSGLAGLAGTPDMGTVLRRADAGDADAALAVAVYLHRLRALVAAMAAALGGVDVLSMSGGVAEHAAPIRAGLADGLGFLGVAVDPDRNQAATGDDDVRISPNGAAVPVFLVRAREDLEIAAAVRDLLGA